MFRIAFLGFVLLVFCSVGFGQETSDYFVRADSWQESLRQSREKLVAETGKASTNRQRRRLWGQVQKAFADTQSQLEMTMDKTERIWDCLLYTSDAADE